MRTLPDYCPVEGLARQVTIDEVAPRDGLQAESAVLPTVGMTEFLERLISAGLPVVEVASFVSPQ